MRRSPSRERGIQVLEAPQLLRDKCDPHRGFADSLRSLYVRENKNKIENFTTSGMSITEMKLQKSLNEIDQQVNEISLSQDMILKNANNKNLRSEEGDKEKAQLQRVFVMREMSLDKIQLMLDVSTHLVFRHRN